MYGHINHQLLPCRNYGGYVVHLLSIIGQCFSNDVYAYSTDEVDLYNLDNDNYITIVFGHQIGDFSFYLSICPQC